MWKTKAVILQAVGAWKFEVIHSEHSHECKPAQASYLPGHRRLGRSEDVIEKIVKYSKMVKNTSLDIAAAVRGDFPGLMITSRDVINVLVTEKMVQAGPLTPTQQFRCHITTTPGITCRIYRRNNSH